MPPKHRVIHRKLVRDRIPAIITTAGRTPLVRTLSPTAYRDALLVKLREELEEFSVSKEIAELADLVEVVQAIIEERGLVWGEFEALRAKKRRERGGFQDRVWLESAEQPESSIE
ncbi:MAG: hypothetical protein ACR2OE_10720 [Thermomicrobiales bacterium]